MDLTGYRKGKFQIEDGTGFQGYTKGNRWNGWACPFFVRDVAEQVLSEPQYGVPGLFYFDEQKDSFVITDADCPDEPYEVPGRDIVVDGEPVHVYGIGSGYWIWSEITDDLPLVKVKVTFTPYADAANLYDIPFKDHLEKPIEREYSNISVVNISTYQSILQDLPDFSGRRAAKYHAEILEENVGRDE